MNDLTDTEILLLLWHIYVVDKAYGIEPPDGSIVASAKRKLQAQLNQGDT